MPFFRKKPVTIEAYQWNRHGDHPEVHSIPFHVHTNVDGITHGWIQTLEGGHIVSPGDWIIKGIKGEYYPCKPDIFDATYYEVTAPHDAKESNPEVCGPAPCASPAEKPVAAGSVSTALFDSERSTGGKTDD